MAGRPQAGYCGRWAAAQVGDHPNLSIHYLSDALID